MHRASDRIAVVRREKPERLSDPIGETEALFRTVANDAPVMLWMTGPDGKVTFFNRGWLLFTGRPLAREIGCGWLENVHPDDRQTTVEQCLRAMRTREPFTIECRLRRVGRDYRWVLGHGCPRLDAAGTFLGYVGSCADIADRKTELAETQQRLENSEEQMRQLAARTETARDQERAAVARELHDELGQTLTAIKLELARAVTGVNRQQLGSAVVDRLQSLVGLVEIGISMVKRISTSLRPPTLDHLGLAAAIRWEAMTFRARTGLRCHVRADTEVTSLTTEQQTVLFRIFQEALTNIVRHAKASAVHVTLAERRRLFEVRIRDNGRGITEAQRADPGAIGLLGMRERASLIGGSFDITGGHGTTVTVRVPIIHVPQRSAPRARRTRTRGQAR